MIILKKTLFVLHTDGCFFVFFVLYFCMQTQHSLWCKNIRALQAGENVRKLMEYFINIFIIFLPHFLIYSTQCSCISAGSSQSWQWVYKHGLLRASGLFSDQRCKWESLEELNVQVFSKENKKTNVLNQSSTATINISTLRMGHSHDDKHVIIFPFYCYKAASKK